MILFYPFFKRTIHRNDVVLLNVEILKTERVKDMTKFKTLKNVIFDGAVAKTGSEVELTNKDQIKRLTELGAIEPVKAIKKEKESDSDK
jgi:hypothetical protein